MPDVTLGPLHFPTVADATTEQLGETLEAVGAVLTPSERRPRPRKLTLPVRGEASDPDPRVTGYRLRRQLRQLLENARWRSQPLYFSWTADPELSGWLMVGGGDLEETNLGVTFGDWTLELTDCFAVGARNIARPGRRLELGDRRTGLVAHDTRGLLFSGAHNAQGIPTSPLFIPGDVDARTIASTRNRSGAAGTTGPYDSALRTLWTACDAIDGDVVTFVPDDLATFEDTGGVRAWDTSASTKVLRPNAPAGIPAYTVAESEDPTLIGWERVLGQVDKRDAPLAIENGMVRVIWLGAGVANLGTSGGLALEYRLASDTGASAGAFTRLGRFGFWDQNISPSSCNLVELTPERAVLEVSGPGRVCRVILQRGWFGPRIEVYNDDGGDAHLHYVRDTGDATSGNAPAGVPAWVRQITSGADLLYVAMADDAHTELVGLPVYPNPDANIGSLAGAAGVAYTRPRVLVAQIGTPAALWLSGWTAADLANLQARLSVVDAQAVPVLLAA